MSLPPPSVGVVSAPFGDAVVLHDPAAGCVHLLDPVAALVWEASRQGRTLASLVVDLARATGDPPAGVERQLEGRVDELVAAGVLGSTRWVAPEPPVSDAGPGRRHRSRTFRVVDEAVVVRSDDGTLVDAVDALLASMACDEPPTVRLDLDLHHAGDDGVTVRLSGPGVDAWWPSVDALLEALPSQLNVVAASSSRCLVLHAGAVVSAEGRVVVLPAPSGAGKSTLTAQVVAAGWGYVSDEAVGVRADDLSVAAYPKPAVLAPDSRSALGLAAQRSSNVPVDALGGGPVVHAPGRVGAVVLPQFVAGAAPEVSVLEPTDAFFALAERALNLPRVGGPGLRALTRLAREVPCRRLVHGGGPDAVDAVVLLKTP